MFLAQIQNPCSLQMDEPHEQPRGIIDFLFSDNFFLLPIVIGALGLLIKLGSNVIDFGGNEPGLDGATIWLHLSIISSLLIVVLKPSEKVAKGGKTESAVSGTPNSR